MIRSNSVKKFIKNINIFIRLKKNLMTLKKLYYMFVSIIITITNKEL